MGSNDELKEIDIKNRACYYFDDIMGLLEFYFESNILGKESSENSHENILIYDIPYKTFMDAKLLSIRFDKLDGFIKIYDGTRYIVVFDPKRYDAIYNRIRYLVSKKKCCYIYY